MKSLLTLGLGLLGLTLSATAVHADDTPSDHRLVRFVLSGGLTYGGDSMASVHDPVTGSDDNYGNIKAGGVFQAGVGVALTPQQLPLSLELTTNYQVDSLSGANGSGTFGRMPVELIGFYNGIPDWRFGVGARYVHDVHFTYQVNGNNFRDDFANTVSPLIQAGYEVGNNIWIDLRWVDEHYKIRNTTSVLPKDYRYSANHAGIFATALF